LKNDEAVVWEDVTNWVQVEKFKEWAVRPRKGSCHPDSKPVEG